MIGLFLGVAGGCSASEPAGFCDSTANVLTGAVKDIRKVASFDEAAFVADLPAIDITSLTEADRRAFTAAITEVESALFSPRGGWTTEPVATVARRLCTQEMPVISAVP
jgi:hypothetical protein